MLTIILSVLKIIGLIILYLLLFVLGIILILLIWPFKYNIISNNKNVLNGKLNLSFLFKIVSVWAVFDKEKEFNLFVKFFGIKIYDNLSKKNEPDSKFDEDYLSDYCDDSFDKPDILHDDSENQTEFISGDNNENIINDYKGINEDLNENLDEYIHSGDKKELKMNRENSLDEKNIFESFNKEHDNNLNKSKKPFIFSHKKL